MTQTAIKFQKINLHCLLVRLEIETDELLLLLFVLKENVGVFLFWDMPLIPIIPSSFGIIVFRYD